MYLRLASFYSLKPHDQEVEPSPLRGKGVFDFCSSANADGHVLDHHSQQPGGYLPFKSIKTATNVLSRIMPGIAVSASLIAPPRGAAKAIGPILYTSIRIEKSIPPQPILTAIPAPPVENTAPSLSINLNNCCKGGDGSLMSACDRVCRFTPRGILSLSERWL